MNQLDALEACPASTHLPSARELAEESRALGAKGILEVSQVNPHFVPAGYYKISAINPGDHEDEFYFNQEGYKRPHGELGDLWFWSSSASTLYSDHAFALYGDDGIVGRVYGGFGDHYAVRCFPNR